MSVTGWPATSGGWEFFGDQEQGGGKGWFRSLAIPRRLSAETGKLIPVGIAVASMSADMGFLGGHCWAAGEHEKTGGRVSASCFYLSSAAVLRFLKSLFLDNIRPFPLSASFVCCNHLVRFSASPLRWFLSTILFTQGLQF